MDFTLETYRNFILTLKQKNYSFLPFVKYIELRLSSPVSPYTSILISRHDVDRIPQNALKLAHLENLLGIKGTYYFRIVPKSYNEQVISEIANLGHEIGYHYEDVDLVSKERGRKGESESGREELIDAAYESFCKNLELFRKNFDLKTICMHGSPRSKYDNKIIWEKYNYKELGIIGEPYFDLDFNEFAYFTDTGRRWNGNNVSVRDKVTSKYNFNFKSTKDIIDNLDMLPDKLMFTIHPERWTNNPIPWTKELLLQNTKNLVKRIIIQTSSQRSQN
ncbi:MAG: hypothetical protein IH950_08135 [Bacteroidetes bacterium]|nr:hypothetical protein [Bacteroidota bacterium]